MVGVYTKHTHELMFGFQLHLIVCYTKQEEIIVDVILLLVCLILNKTGGNTFIFPTDFVS